MQGQDWSDTFIGVSGGLDFHCTPAATISAGGLTSCTLELSGIPIQAIETTCRATECYDTSLGQVLLNTREPGGVGQAVVGCSGPTLVSLAGWVGNRQ